MYTLLSFILIAAATSSVLSFGKLDTMINAPPKMMLRSIGRRSIRFADVKHSGFVSRPSCSTRLSIYSHLQYDDSNNRSLIRPVSILQRHSFFHTSTALMMGAKRKRNGGKSKKVKEAIMSKTALKKLANSSDKESELLGQNEELTIEELLEAEADRDSGDGGDSSVSTEFATDYHAPVMPIECVQALLKQGIWADLLETKRNRWRRKRSIVEAKRKRMGYHEENEDDDAEEGESVALDNDELEHIEEIVCENMQPRLFIDGTLGGGGHSQAILEQLKDGDVLIGCDVDPEALSTASNRLVDYLGTREYILDKQVDGSSICGWEAGRPMFIPVQGNFRDLISVLSRVRHPSTGRLLLGNRDASENNDNSTNGDIEFPAGADGMLLDLGVSSHQIDTPDRGFAFMKEGPLDMRMSGSSLISSRSSSSSLTAADICNEFDEPSIISILQTFGDEPRAKRIASAIVAARPLYSTTDLVHAINSVTPTFARQKRAGLIATSARVFQAFRIAVNEEDGALRDVLEKVAPWALSRSGGMMKAGDVGEGNGGMLVVLSYHSMEDKMAKRVMRDGSVNFLDGHRRKGGALERDIFGNVIGENELDGGGSCLPFEPLGKPQKATDEEIAVNSRARSATLRVGIRN
jgi:16S rRNA (cytosine1402-N4)-methyltransferase